jgi:hypothetical protein
LNFATAGSAGVPISRQGVAISDAAKKTAHDLAAPGLGMLQQ